jgi:hypothetical protein
MQKAAGTSFILRLYLHFPEAAIYPNPDDGDVQAEAPQGDVAGLLERWPARRDDIQVIAGHFPLCTTRLLGEEFRTMTVLRDPVERTLSYLRHRRVLVAEDRDKSLEEIYDDPWAFPLIIENHMTRMLALEPEEVTWGPLSQMPYTPERLEQAKANLAAIDVFGLQDHMGEFWTDVQERFSWQLPPMPRFNTTEPVPVGDSPVPGSPRTTRTTWSCGATHRTCTRAAGRNGVDAGSDASGNLGREVVHDLPRITRGAVHHVDLVGRVAHPERDRVEGLPGVALVAELDRLPLRVLVP